ncbi:hypothetical protein O6H91_08G036600 [Diphasiastrum complanatum]|uniref:Uncharacterized protein n=2 Tax=Diphasiastrum complanatum TaxID=34168 RepID=A0ACC2CWE5_DIPCM|nr:hypothetical protein O6H91_16G036400 [Diphasiastrum complanatum]KAJ7546349.1 hypothetical protein O6H91_08G036600 [Diphasiastrum complanatum]
MVGIAVLSLSASARLGQALLLDEVSMQSIYSLLNVVTASVAEGSLCASISSLGIFFLDLLETGELTIPDSCTKKKASLTPAQYDVQQDESTWLREVFEVYSKSLLDLMDKKQTPSSVQALAFELLKDLVASRLSFYLSSEINKRASKKMPFAPTLPIPIVEGSLLTNNKYEDKRATGFLLGSLRECSKYACKLSRSEKEITKLLSNASGIVNVNEQGRSRKRKAGQWGLVAATRDEDDDDDDEDDADEEEDDYQGECDDNDEQKDDNDDEEEGGDGHASDEDDVADEGEEDEPEEEDDDDDDDDDEDNNEDDEEDEDEEEEEPPKKKKK